MTTFAASGGSCENRCVTRILQKYFATTSTPKLFSQIQLKLPCQSKNLPEERWFMSIPCSDRARLYRQYLDPLSPGDFTEQERQALEQAGIPLAH